MKKICVLSLVALFLAAVLCSLHSCGGGKDENDNSGVEFSDDAKTDGGQGQSPEEHDEKYRENLPDMDFGGREMVFAVADFDWAPRHLEFESQSGELIEDAVYRRNRNTEERYNFALKTTTKSESAVLKEILAGERSFEAAFLRTDMVSSGASQGAFVDLNAVPHIDLNKHYWDQSAKEQFSIKNKLYFMLSDIEMNDRLLTSVIAYNKKLVHDLNIEPLYPLVFDGKWTIDKFNEMIRNTSQIITGGDKFTLDDFYGHATQNQANLTLFYASGERFVDKDENDVPYIRPMSATMAKTVEKIIEVMRQNNSTLNHRPGNLNAFIDDRAVFFTGGTDALKDFRGMETDFGILPMPKRDEAQPHYITDVNPITPSVVIPVNLSGEELAFCGFVLEALAAESRRILVPAFYDVTMKIKYARDDESSQIIDMAFEHRAFDLMFIHNFGRFSSSFDSQLSSGKLEVVSFYEANIPAAEAALEKFVDAFG